VAFLTDPDSSLWRYANLLGYNSSKAALNAITLIYAATLRDSGIKVNALSPGFCATDLNNHAGHLSAAEGGAHIARQVTPGDDGPTGVFLSEIGGTHPW
jgi:NAD(P)-dependent dehydrogenase (short-subunit alcohol dehydrogenase family)